MNQNKPTHMMIEFNDKFHPEFEGWLWQKDKEIWVSFIISKEEGKGNFRKLLDELKDKYNCIRIPTPSSRMWAIAKLNGFHMEYSYDKKLDDTLELMTWRK